MPNIKAKLTFPNGTTLDLDCPLHEMQAILKSLQEASRFTSPPYQPPYYQPYNPFAPFYYGGSTATSTGSNVPDGVKVGTPDLGSYASDTLKFRSEP